MPYEGEYASKASHYDIVKNPEVAQFLQSCDYLTVPSEQEGQMMSARFEVAPPLDEVILPERVIAVDGSDYEASIDQHLPSTKVGYVKIGSILIDMAQFHSLRVDGRRLVDPFRVAELQSGNSPLTFSLPSANIRWKGKTSVRDGFRAAVDEYFYHAKTRFSENDPKTSLRTTLFHLASRRSEERGTEDPRRLQIHKCPTCREGPLTVEDIPSQQKCRFCGNDIYPSDCLRLWEEVSDYQSNTVALSRFMLVVEHILPIHYIRYLAENSFPLLGSLAFFIDGPLALFGPAAWLHSSILRYLGEIQDRLSKSRLPSMVMIGLQKTGQVTDHAMLIQRFVQPHCLFAVDDDYRYQYIRASREPSANGFGAETYYGQDFIYKTHSGRTFVFALPYPFSSKNECPDFRQVKTNVRLYQELPKALALINHFEADLYKNALIPVALAHRYTAISLVPGGRVLDLLTRKALMPNP